jgi:hypothetical protein
MARQIGGGTCTWNVFDIFSSTASELLSRVFLGTTRGASRLVAEGKQRRANMHKLLLAATVVSALVSSTGTGALAQNDRQATPAQQNFKDSVKGEPRTPKRENIIRSESGQGHAGRTTGTAPNGR